jgi:putative acetyltransferase
MTESKLQIHPMCCPADAFAFRTLNEEWIQKLFTLEEKDSRTLNDPESQIVAKGGQVYIAELDGERIGAVALLAYGDGDFELSKMAVAPGVRGQGIGRRLIVYTLEQARSLGARRVFLGSNSVLANAVHLYEALGFKHVQPAELPTMGYARADVHMTHNLRVDRASA